jgi:Cyclic-phosphate processing Receiver domain
VKPWLDDIRPARSINQAIKLLEAHDFAYASLDHELGDYAEYGGDGYTHLRWMAEHDR